MKTDETNLPRDPPKVQTRRPVDPPAPVVATHPKDPGQREQDALDAWRRLREEGRSRPDPVIVHGLDLANAPPETRAVVEAFGEDLARLHEALEAAEARLARAEEARRADPETGLLRLDVLLTEIRHLEALDRREGVASEVAVFRIDGVPDLLRESGWVAVHDVIGLLGTVLAGAVLPGEPAGRLGDGAFAVLLTGLSGGRARARAADLGGRLVQAIDTDHRASALRPGSIRIGLAALGAMEDPLHALDRADRDAGRS